MNKIENDYADNSSNSTSDEGRRESGNSFNASVTHDNNGDNSSRYSGSNNRDSNMNSNNNDRGSSQSRFGRSNDSRGGEERSSYGSNRSFGGSSRSSFGGGNRGSSFGGSSSRYPSSRPSFGGSSRGSFGGSNRGSSFGGSSRGSSFGGNRSSTFNNDVIVKLFCEEGCKIAKATNDSAAYDLHSAEALEIQPWTVAKIRTGVFMNMTFKSMVLVCSRSGLATEGIFVLNAPGIIDSDYQKEICVILANFSDNVATINQGDRIAQALFIRTSNIKLEFVNDKDELSSSSNRDGFGSTGR